MGVAAAATDRRATSDPDRFVDGALVPPGNAVYLSMQASTAATPAPAPGTAGVVVAGRVEVAVDPERNHWQARVGERKRPATRRSR